MSDNPFGRVITAMVTPMHDDGSIDFDGLQRLAVHLADHGHDGLLVNGTTGESATTSDEEDYDCVAAVVEAVGDRVSVMAGCGTNDTLHSIRAAEAMVARGADTLLVVTPYYNKPTQHGIVEHFRMITEAAGAGQYELPGFAPVPRIQIVTIEAAMALRDRAVQLPARRDDGFKRAAKEVDRGAQGALDL